MIKELFKIPPPFQLNIIFFIFTSLIVVIFSYKIPAWPDFLLIFISMAIFQYFLCKTKENGVLNFLKNVGFPLFSVLVAFDSVGVITPLVNPEDLDQFLMTLDYKILGFYPYIVSQKITFPLLTEIMQISYCVYYFLPFVIGVYILLKGYEMEFQRALFLLLLCYYLSYIGYLLFPALGPRYYVLDAFYIDLKGVFLAEKINSLLNSLEGIKRDAFPSGHVAVSLLVLYIMWEKNKKLFYIFFIPVILLIISTIYCRYHYFVDVIGGVFLTVVTLFIGRLYYNFWLYKNEISINKRQRRIYVKSSCENRFQEPGN